MPKGAGPAVGRGPQTSVKSQSVKSSSSSSRKPQHHDIISLSEDDPTDTVRARSCCGCLFFILVLWIWLALPLSLIFDDLANRDVTIRSGAETGKTATLICKWNKRTMKFGQQPDESEILYSTACSNAQLLCESQKKGVTFLVLLLSVSPFAVALMISCCLKNGDEEPDQLDPRKKENVRKFEASKILWARIKSVTKFIGLVGTLGFEVLAYWSFSSAWNDCTSTIADAAVSMAISTKTAEPTFTHLAGASIGISSVLILSAAAVTGILVIVVVVLIVILTSENSDQLNFVLVLASAMSAFGCDGACPECAGGIDCADAETGEMDCEECCCC